MNTVKAIGELLIGRGIVYGGRDLEGDTFTKETDLGKRRDFNGMPVFYDHGLGGLKSQVGHVTSWREDDEGIEFAIELEKRHQYADVVLRLAQEGALGLSTGALGHLVERKGGYIKRWIVGEVSLTPTPAEPRTIAQPAAEAKAVQADAPEDAQSRIPTITIIRGTQ